MRKAARLQAMLTFFVLVAVLAALPACGRGEAAHEAVKTKPAGDGVLRLGAASQDNIVLQWNNAVVESIPASGLGGPPMARAFAIINTCIYDAWAAYDATALGTRLGADLRRPAAERTLANQEKAISFAAYRAAVDLIPGSKASLFDPLMSKLGYDPKDTSTSRAAAAGVGNVACQAVLDFRHKDGANQLADMPSGDAGVPYSDHTGYKPVNDPMDLRGAFNPATVKDAAHWQPLTYVDATNKVVTPEFVCPHWGKVVPFALTSGDQFRSSTGPAKPGTDQYKKQAQELIDLSAGLTEQQKVMVYYWAEEPPPRLWNQFAQFVSRRDGHGADLKGTADDVKLFFALSNALLDAGIAGWDNKAHFDYVRPITAIRSLFSGQKIKAWGGPGKGTLDINGEDWIPYGPATFRTPPFAEYTSGHSVFSTAGAEILKRFTGSDTFGHSVTVKAGAGGYESGVPAADLTLRWNTFSAAGDEASMSRRYGGYHFEQGDVDGRELGRKVAGAVWVKAQSLFNETAPAPGGVLPRTI
jgi:uncharacterized protein DUF6851/vanadium-dependent haloperoxidase-like protein